MRNKALRFLSFVCGAVERYPRRQSNALLLNILRPDLHAQRHALEFPLVELEPGREMVTCVEVEPNLAAPASFL